MRPAAVACALLAALALALGTGHAHARPVRVPPGGFPLDCVYQPKDSDEGTTSYTRCARRGPDGWRIAPVHLARMEFRHRFAEAFIEGGSWAWVAHDGRALPTLTFDNGPDPYSHGLTRVREGGHIAFYDRGFRRVLATPYDWASPFGGRGRAVVCSGCASDGTEMGFIVGGRWGEIDRTGRVVVPVTLSASELSARLAGKRTP